MLLRKGASINQRAKGNFFLPIDQQDGKLHTTTTDFTGKLFDSYYDKKLLLRGNGMFEGGKNVFGKKSNN